MDLIASTGIENAEDRETWLSYIAPALMRDGRKIVLMEAGKDLAGYFQYSLQAGTFIMEELQIKPEYQGTGLFNRLFLWLLGQLPDGIQWVEAFANKKNNKSRSILRHLGLSARGENQSGSSFHYKCAFERFKAHFEVRRESIRALYGNRMTQRQSEIIQLVNRALEQFNQHEQYLIRHDLSEQCICAKFAFYLEKAAADSSFTDYTVDVEYNRGAAGNEYVAKVLRNKRIIPDLIIHRRGYDLHAGFDNLACIEMKKSRRFAMSEDLQRLDLLTHNEYGYCYQAGFMIVIYANRQADDYRLKVHTIFLNTAYM